MLGIIAGSGMYSLGKKVGEIDVETKYGSVSLQKVRILDEEMIFLPRHGTDHAVPAHMVNHRANISALSKVGVSGVLSIYASGIISGYKIGDIIQIEDFIGLLSPATFYDDFSGGIRHTDFSEPFDLDMQTKLEEVASAVKVKLKDGGIIATTTGPRYETKTEVAFLRSMGANLVNMTAAPELSLLGEAEIDHVALAVGTNFAAGVSKKPLSAQEVEKSMKGAYGKLVALIGGFAEEIV